MSATLSKSADLVTSGTTPQTLTGSLALRGEPRNPLLDCIWSTVWWNGEFRASAQRAVWQAVFPSSGRIVDQLQNSLFGSMSGLPVYRIQLATLLSAFPRRETRGNGGI